jgi:Macrocin-O-methyltransferase (TylF)
LTLACDQLLKEQIIGDAIELGVWRGDIAVILTEFTRRVGSTTYLLGTFSGFSKDDLTGVDAKKKIEFTDFPPNTVSDLVGSDGVKFVKGSFPDTQDQIPIGAACACVHIDCDLYNPFKSGLEFFYPRLVRGGLLVMHDYSSLYWDGVEKAIDEFFADKPEMVIPISDKSGTAVIRKITLWLIHLSAIFAPLLRIAAGDAEIKMTSEGSMLAGTWLR